MIDNFSRFSYQINLFPKVNALSDLKATAAALINNAFYDGDPTILPINRADAPPELPIITLKSIDGLKTCEISTQKVSLTWQKGELPELNLNLAEVERIVKEVMSAVMGKISIKRIGCITTYARTIDVIGNEHIALLSTAHSSKLSLPDTGNLLRYRLNLTYNMVMTSHPACFKVIDFAVGKTASPQQADVLALQQDINTQPDEGNDFDMDKLTKFIKEAEMHSGAEEVLGTIWQ